jgi:hypothetical protein
VETRFAAVTVIAAVIAVSGCSALPIPSGGGGGNTAPTQPEMVSGKGLEVTNLKVTDNTVTPGQEVQVTLNLKNYHREPITINEITLYNLGLLSASDKECTPEEIKPAKEQGVYPVMECTWNVEAPTEEEIGGFEQRKTSVGASIPYESVIQNFQPMKLEFKPLDDVNKTDKKVMTYSNGEVKINMQTESPVPRGQFKLVKFHVQEVGKGRVNGSYEFDYSPSSVFVTESHPKADEVKDKFICPESEEPVLDDQLEFSCYAYVEEAPQSAVRNLFFTASYKYVQAPSLDITIVS